MSDGSPADTARKTLLRIEKAQAGVIRVFAISRPMADMARALQQQPATALASALLGHPVSDDDVELFAIADLAGVGLPRYLTDGYDVDPDALRKDRARLEALDGYVLLLHSRVAHAGDVVLSPTAELTLIGTYTEPAADHVAPPLAVEAAMPYSGARAAPVAPRRSRIGSAITGLATLLILALIWWILR